MPLMPPHCSLLSGEVTHIENVTPSPGHQTDIKAIPTIPRPRRLISSFSYYESPQYRMSATFSDLSDREVELVAEALKGTTWLAVFRRVSKVCKGAAASVEEDEAALRRLNVDDLVQSVELVTWALDQGCPRTQGWRGLCGAAARGGHLETLQWLRANGHPWNVFTCAAAAEGGHLEVLQWARANGCEWDEDTCFEAAQGGHLEVLQWARANGCEWDEGTCSLAARGGHLEVLQWARANGCKWNECTCSCAAQGGHLEVLQWARANGCEWNGSTCSSAAREGHLEILQWARANGCEWTKGTCTCAARGGHLEVLKWLRANGCEWDKRQCYTEQ